MDASADCWQVVSLPLKPNDETQSLNQSNL